MIDGSGAIVSRYDYDPYGRATLVSGTNLSDFQYAGYYQHATSGLNLTKYRAYDPTVGRWMSRDPLPNAEMKQGPNLYAYCLNEPLLLSDPLGLAWYNDVGTALDNFLGNLTGTDPNAWQQSGAATANGALFGFVDFPIQPGNQYNQCTSEWLGLAGTVLAGTGTTIKIISPRIPPPPPPLYPPPYVLPDPPPLPPNVIPFPRQS